jgi:hypothetical protein
MLVAKANIYKHFRDVGSNMHVFDYWYDPSMRTKCRSGSL